MSSLIVEVCRIESVRQHPKADRLDIVQVKGFQCIVGRDEYTLREGIVIRPKDERTDRFGRLILKAISQTYLIRKAGTERH